MQRAFYSSITNLLSMHIPLLHTDVSVRACTSCRPFVITNKLLDTVDKHRFVYRVWKISVLCE